MGRRRKTGTPPGPKPERPGHSRRVRLRVVLADDEAAQVIEESRFVGVSAWIRTAILDRLARKCPLAHLDSRD